VVLAALPPVDPLPESDPEHADAGIAQVPELPLVATPPEPSSQEPSAQT